MFDILDAHGANSRQNILRRKGQHDTSLVGTGLHFRRENTHNSPDFE